MNKKGVGMILWMFILLAVFVGVSVQNVKDFNVEEFKDKLEWQEIDLNITTDPELAEAIEDGANGLGKAAMGIGKWVSSLSAEYPKVPFKLILFFIILAIAAPVIILLVKLGAIIFILTREYFQSRKEKKMMEKSK